MSKNLKSNFNQGDIRRNKKIQIGDKQIVWINQLEDGNCLFRALSHCLFGDSKFHWNLRILIIIYIRLNKEKYFHIFENGYFQRDDKYFGAETHDGIFNNYINFMTISNLQGGEIELIVISDIIASWSDYSQPILTYSIYNHKLTCRTIGMGTLIESENPIILYHKAHNHYWAGKVTSPNNYIVIDSNINNFVDIYNSLKLCSPNCQHIFTDLGEEYDFFDYNDELNIIQSIFS
tara:strand:- start:231 stop:932 length:702 start_codon:yes stop_codon:yes gene_type:complete